MPRAIGLMSGTSMDGVDAAWIDTDGEQIFALGPRTTIAYDPRMKAFLRRAVATAPEMVSPRS